MSVQLLLFVIAVLLFVNFWELCKINSNLKRTFSAASRMLQEGQAHDAVIAKAVEAR
jgi:competence protein ComGC